MDSPVTRLVRPAVLRQKPYKPGTTVDQAKARYGLAHVVKLSQNENPLGCSPKAAAALASVGDLSVYFDDDYPELRTRLAAPFGLTKDNIIVGHGSNDVLMTLFEAFIEAGDEIVMADPTFSLFPKYTLLRDGVPVRVPLRDGVHDLDAMLAAITQKTKFVIVVDPNNPTGTQVDPAAFDRFVAALPIHVVLVIDQAYREYMPAASVEGADIVKRRPLTMVTRTMSKIFGLAALRFGYAISSPEMIEVVQRVRTPFNVSGPAVAAVLAALDDAAFMERTLRTNAEGKAYLECEFARLGLTWYPSAANFIAVRIPAIAEEAYEALLARGVVVRSGDGLGLPNHLRITIGTPEENAVLVAALESLASEWRAAPALL